MAEDTLGDALVAMQSAPEDDAARLRFYEALADAELWLLLDAPPADERIAPRVLPVDGTDYLLAFDGPDRLADFAGGAAETATLPGRALAAMMAGQGVGLVLNPGADRASTMLPPDALDWLADLLSRAPATAEARLSELRPPGRLPADVLDGLARRLSRSGGLAEAAFLAGAVWGDGRHGHVLAFVGAADHAEPALAQAAAEALSFSGIDAGTLDVMFVTADQPIAASLSRVGLRFDLPAGGGERTTAAPGSDPARPPKLR